MLSNARTIQYMVIGLLFSKILPLRANKEFALTRPPMHVGVICRIHASILPNNRHGRCGLRSQYDESMKISRTKGKAPAQKKGR